MFRLIILVCIVFCLVGCAATGVPTTQSANKCCAECLVCKKNADLACINVDVTASTPSYVYQGKTYYFCSEDCRKDFIKNPPRYLSP